MKKVLIVGGNSGIGLAAAELFRKHQHKVTVASRSNRMDFLDEARVRKYFKEKNGFHQIVVTSTTP